ncbi:MAG: hypothetical protein LBH11_02040 [Propionibacteriaceae bacterium]|jgi:hypothetical protein|nr:hypothetical protein [Propionibacteriaceae bacterium]
MPWTYAVCCRKSGNMALLGVPSRRVLVRRVATRHDAAARIRFSATNPEGATVGSFDTVDGARLISVGRLLQIVG